MRELFEKMIDESMAAQRADIDTIKKKRGTDFKIKDAEYDGYKLNLEISYVEDLEYDKVVELILVRKDKYLYVVEKN